MSNVSDPSSTEAILVRWTSRKFWTMMFWQTVNTALVFFDKIPHEVYESLTWLLLGAYFITNAAQHILKGRQ